MMPPKTSIDSPLRIAQVAPPGGGVIGMTICPGKHAPTSVSGHGWARDVAIDVAAIKAWGASTVVTLMERWELETYKVPLLGKAITDACLQWIHLPIIDGEAPDEPWDKAWPVHSVALRRRLLAGERLLIHCLGGRGRTGTVAARLLIELGVSVEEAIEQVRRAREGAIETQQQEDYLRRLKWNGGNC